MASYVTRAKEDGIVAHLLAIIPDSFFGAFASGDLLQVLLVVDPDAASPSRGSARSASKIARAIETAGKMFFRIIAHHRAGRADRRVRRHGLHHRRLRPRLAGQPRSR